MNKTFLQKIDNMSWKMESENKLGIIENEKQMG